MMSHARGAWLKGRLQAEVNFVIFFPFLSPFLGCCPRIVLVSGWWGFGGGKRKTSYKEILPRNGTCSTDMTCFATDIGTPRDHQEDGPAYVGNLFGE